MDETFEAPQAVSKVLQTKIPTHEKKLLQNPLLETCWDRNPKRKSETLIPDQNWKLCQLRQKCYRRDRFGGKEDNFSQKRDQVSLEKQSLMKLLQLYFSKETGVAMLKSKKTGITWIV